MKTPAFIPLMILALCASPAAHAADEPVAAPATAPAAAAPALPAGSAPVAAKKPVAASAEARKSGAKPAAEVPAAKPADADAKAKDSLELDTTQITGNKELPRVMYVVPWKRSDMGEFGGRPAKSLLDEVLAPVDRDVFRRQTRYYNALQPDAPAATDAAGGK